MSFCKTHPRKQLEFKLWHIITLFSAGGPPDYPNLNYLPGFYFVTFGVYASNFLVPHFQPPYDCNWQTLGSGVAWDEDPRSPGKFLWRRSSGEPIQKKQMNKWLKWSLSVYRWLKQVETEPTFRQYTEIIDIRHPPSAFCPHGLSAPKPFVVPELFSHNVLDCGRPSKHAAGWQAGGTQGDSGEALRSRTGVVKIFNWKKTPTLVGCKVFSDMSQVVGGQVSKNWSWWYNLLFRVTWGQVTMLVCTPCTIAILFCNHF